MISVPTMCNDEIDLMILLNCTWHLFDKTIGIPVVAGEPQVSHHNILRKSVHENKYGNTGQECLIRTRLIRSTT